VIDGAAPIRSISGTVGATKTTVAKLVVEPWGAPVAYLEALAAVHTGPAGSPGGVTCLERSAVGLIQKLRENRAGDLRQRWAMVCPKICGGA
jgi:hypothetical protein